jgi:DNA-binding NarL/FixJ family response regulator
MRDGELEITFTVPNSLTPRELEIAALIADGLSNKQIAADLKLSYSTVKNHISSILEKLDLDHRTQVAILLLFARHNRRETQYLFPIDPVHAQVVL